LPWLYIFIRLRCEITKLFEKDCVGKELFLDVHRRKRHKVICLRLRHRREHKYCHHFNGHYDIALSAGDFITLSAIFLYLY